MKGFCLASLGLASILVVACAGDDVSPGARARCAQGGELTDCPDAERTPYAACWRLVECGSIAVTSVDPDDPNNSFFDWDSCMNRIETMTADRERLVINCIAASTCDQLRVDGSPDRPNEQQLYCIQLGNRNDP